MYIFQKKNQNPYECASYAIYNLLQHRNQNTDLNGLIDNCQAQEKIGTLVKNFNNTIKHLHLDHAENISIKTIKEINRPIIILFHWYQDANKGNHYALIDKHNKNEHGVYTYRVINYSFDNPIKIITERELKSMLLPYEDDNFKMPQIWY